MSFIDCLLLTLFSAAICITLPKMLALIEQNKINKKTNLKPEFKSKETSSKVPSLT